MTNAASLGELARIKHDGVQMAVIHNEETGYKTFKWLAQPEHSSYDVRFILAGSDNTPVDILERLAVDEDQELDIQDMAHNNWQDHLKKSRGVGG